MHVIMNQWKEQQIVAPKGLMVIGCSTSEIAGEHIGTSGSTEIAEAIFTALEAFRNETGIELAFQCCEHLNRALVVERHVMQERGLEEVSAIPHAKAGGSMATFAFEQMDDPVLVDSIQADFGMDLGDTLIGMHLKHVAVPLRLSQTSVGDAHATFAYTRPKLIGGERAIYRKNNT
ncbi:TIGR01440 family protein [Aquisalibacillus elongatus]|uniref:TIGR01440 family protein n=1 Tax=Aquisalibacillus elongatus TaxID=485577 RepID=UPI00248273D5|nr:TIGR01440 family protein [Aquisalibacillus elongatus]